MDEEIAPLLADLPGPDGAAASAIRERAWKVLRPTGALARLDEVAAWLAGWQRMPAPAVRRPAAVVFVADHGVVSEGVSAYPSEVTAAMFRALEEGVATAAVMAREIGARLQVVDVGVGRPSANLVREPALSKDRLNECFETGRGAVAELDADLLVLGEMGIANTTPAAAVCAALFGGARRGVDRPGHRDRRRDLGEEGGCGQGGAQADRRSLRAPRGPPPGGWTGACRHRRGHRGGAAPVASSGYGRVRGHRGGGSPGGGLPRSAGPLRGWPLLG